MKRYSGIVEKLCQVTDRIAGWCIAATMLVMVLNIILRAVFKQPIVGTIDYVNILTAMAIGLALACCALQNGQIAVDFVVERLSTRKQALIDIMTNLVALVFWGLAAWYLAGYARSMVVSGLVSTTSQVPLYPVVYILALGFLGLCLVLISKLADSVRKVML